MCKIMPILPVTLQINITFQMSTLECLRLIFVSKVNDGHLFCSSAVTRFLPNMVEYRFLFIERCAMLRLITYS